MIAKYADRIQDPRYTFLPGDEFFEQVRVIESAEKDILAHRDLFSDVKENRGAVTNSRVLIETGSRLWGKEFRSKPGVSSGIVSRPLEQGYLDKGAGIHRSESPG